MIRNMYINLKTRTVQNLGFELDVNTPEPAFLNGRPQPSVPEIQI